MTVLILSITACSSGSSGANAKSQSLVPQTRSLVNGLITVGSGQYYDCSFSVNTNSMQNVSVTGSFTASGGSGNDTQVLVIDDMALTNWKNGHQANVYFDSGKMTTGNINANIPSSGQYHLIFSNTFSTISSKKINTNANLNWSELR